MSAKTTLYELHRLITDDGMHVVDPGITQAHVQRDMEAAQRVGLVRIERISDYTHYYRLTTPDGRDWVIANEAHLQAIARVDRKKRDPRSPFGRI